MAYLSRVATGTGTTSATVPYGAALYPGDIVVVATTMSSTITAITYSDGFNTYTPALSLTNAPVTYVAYTVVTQFTPAATNLSLTWGGNTRTPAVVVRVYRPDLGETLGVPTFTSATSAAGSVASLAVTATAPTTSAGYIYVASVATSGTSTTTTYDTDTLEGTWSAGALVSNTRTITYQHKFSDGRSTQTYNITTSTANAKNGFVATIPIARKYDASVDAFASSVFESSMEISLFAASDSFGDAKLGTPYQLNDDVQLSAISSSTGIEKLDFGGPLKEDLNIYLTSFTDQFSSTNYDLKARDLTLSRTSFADFGTAQAIFDVQNVNFAGMKSDARLMLRTEYSLDGLSAVASPGAVFIPRSVSRFIPPESRAHAISFTDSIFGSNYNLRKLSTENRSFANIDISRTIDISLSATARSFAEDTPNVTIIADQVFAAGMQVGARSNPRLVTRISPLRGGATAYTTETLNFVLVPDRRIILTNQSRSSASLELSVSANLTPSLTSESAERDSIAAVYDLILTANSSSYANAIPRSAVGSMLFAGNSVYASIAILPKEFTQYVGWGIRLY